MHIFPLLKNSGESASSAARVHKKPGRSVSNDRILLGMVGTKSKISRSKFHINSETRQLYLKHQEEGGNKKREMS